MRRQLSASLVVALITLGAGSPLSHAQPPAFDFDTGNAIFEVIGPVLIPPLLQTTTPNDAPHILRLVVVIDNAWFDAIAPYHPTAVGVYSRLGRRPASEGATNRQRNIAILYASYRDIQQPSACTRKLAHDARGSVSIPTTAARTPPPPSASATSRAGAWSPPASATA